MAHDGNEWLPKQTKASWHSDLSSGGCSLGRKYCFVAELLAEQPRSLLTFPWRPPEHSDPAFSPSTSFLISLAQGQAPERAPGFYAFFVFFVYPWHKPASSVDCWEGTWRLQISKLQLSKGMCLLSTLNYNLTYGKNKNTAMCIFSPAMIIIVLQTCFKLQLPKWKKHFKK